MNITMSSSYYLRIEDFVLSSAFCTRHVTGCQPPLSKLPRKKLSPSDLFLNLRCLGTVHGGYGFVGGSSPSPVDIRSMNAAAPFFASEDVLSFHGQAARPPP